MIKIQIKSIFGKVLFEYEKEDNTLKDTILEAIKNKISLSYANMSDADMRGANMSYANMSDADMRGANMSYANMRGANMSDADMRGANMSGADTDKKYIQIACIGSAKRMTTYC
jgi:uncharacterized protein YjbI with pentapeptide repeats